jgi:hypothetical protein
MSIKKDQAGAVLSGQRQKLLRQWLGLALPQFAELTPESTATHSRRETEDAPLTGPTSALVLVLEYVYGLREGPARAQVEQVRALLVNDPTRRHFIGRFGAAALMLIIQDTGLSIAPLLAQVQEWCQRDHRQTIERTTAAQLQRAIGFSSVAIGSVVGAALAEMSWNWLAQLFTRSAPTRQRLAQKGGGTKPESTRANPRTTAQEQKGGDN